MQQSELHRRCVRLALVRETVNSSWKKIQDKSKPALLSERSSGASLAPRSSQNIKLGDTFVH